MSKYGDTNMHMEEMYDSLVDRASEVGFAAAMAEALRVLRDFATEEGG